MLRRMNVPLLLCLLLFMALPALAQDEWSVLVFTGDEFIRVGADGVLDTYPFMPPTGGRPNSSEMVISPDGNLVTACKEDFSLNPSGEVVLFQRQIDTDETTFEISMSEGIMCSLTGSEDGSLLALVVIYVTPFTEGRETTKPIWALHVVDAQSGEITHTLTADDVPPEVMAYESGEVFEPHVFHFEGSSILFGEMFYDLRDIGEIPAYRWDFETGDFEAAPEWGHLFSDYLPATGEYVWLGYDESLGATHSGAALPPNNVVYVRDRSGETRTVFYSPDLTLADVMFIDNGEQLALELLAPYNPGQVWRSRWIAVDRAGNQTELFAADAASRVLPAPGGYAALIADFSAEQLRLDYGSDDGTVTLWTATGTNLSRYALAYVTPGAAAEDLPPFTEITPKA